MSPSARTSAPSNVLIDRRRQLQGVTLGRQRGQHEQEHTQPYWNKLHAHIIRVRDIPDDTRKHSEGSAQLSTAQHTAEKRYLSHPSAALRTADGVLLSAVPKSLASLPFLAKSSEPFESFLDGALCKFDLFSPAKSSQTPRSRRSRRPQPSRQNTESGNTKRVHTYPAESARASCTPSNNLQKSQQFESSK